MFEDYKKLLTSIEAIAKTKEGYGYTYLELTPLLDIVMPKILEHNFILTQTVRQADGVFTRDIEEPAVYEDKNTRTRTIEGVVKKHIQTPAYVLHSELIHSSGKKIECDMPLYVDDIDPQAIGSAETYMRRYSIYTLLNIRVKDNDGLDGSANGKKNKATQENKTPLPEDINEIATFLAQQSNPKIYYRDIVNNSKIPDDLKKKLKKIMYP
ncbi:MAG: ERF family protein [Alphaproteobacteria bacterium]|nr:ERF family protein [Alphaproteobacteria bacterium]